MKFKFQKYNGQVIEIDVTGTQHIIEKLSVYEQPIEYQKTNALYCQSKQFAERLVHKFTSPLGPFNLMFSQMDKVWEDDFAAISCVMSKLIPPVLNDETQADIARTLKYNSSKK